jgi:enoyl-CoA hydratase/carnithine racemase
MQNDTVVYEVKNRIGWITLNRPEAMNAMNQEMSGEIVAPVGGAGRERPRRRPDGRGDGRSPAAWI